MRPRTFKPDPDTVSLAPRRKDGSVTDQSLRVYIGKNGKRYEDLTGRNFGRLTVICRLDDGSGVGKWDCQCSCGNSAVVKTIDLKRPNRGSRSCGCLSRENYEQFRAVRAAMSTKPPGVSQFHSLLNAYIQAARSRGYAFELTGDQFKGLVLSPCYYCDGPPARIQLKSRCKTGAPRVLFNGVDRVDNEVGYTPDNCVPCCKTCNSAKNTQSLDAFRIWANRLAERIARSPW